MSFYSYKNANPSCCPGTISGNVLDGLDEKICIGQGYRGKTGVLGVGHCTCKFQNYVEGCPPLEGDIYEFLKEYIGERTPGK